MALTTTAYVALALAAASAGAQYHNTTSTARRQDQEAAAGIRTQSGIQQRADARVNEEVERLKTSTAEDERAKRTSDFMTALSNARGKTEEGLDANAGLGSTFGNAATAARGGLNERGATTAGLLAGIDAPGLQRQGEAFDYGNLATDISLFNRESQGAQFLTDLRTRSIRRSPGIDAGAQFMGGLSSGLAGAGGAGAGAGAFASGNPYKGGIPGKSAASGWGSLSSQPTNDQLLAAMRYGMGGT